MHAAVAPGDDDTIAAPVDEIDNPRLEVANRSTGLEPVVDPGVVEQFRQSGQSTAGTAAARGGIGKQEYRSRSALP